MFFSPLVRILLTSCLGLDNRRYDYLEFTDSRGGKVRYDMKVGTEKWPKVRYEKNHSSSLHMKHCCLWIAWHISVASLGSYRRWHLTLALSSSFSSTLTAVIMSGVISSPWQLWASRISLFLGCQTCSCWWLAWWVVLLPEPSPWNPPTVRLIYETFIKLRYDLKCACIFEAYMNRPCRSDLIGVKGKFTWLHFSDLWWEIDMLTFVFYLLFQRYALLRTFHKGKCPMFSPLLYGNPFCDTGCVKQKSQISLKEHLTRYGWICLIQFHYQLYIMPVLIDFGGSALF